MVKLIVENQSKCGWCRFLIAIIVHSYHYFMIISLGKKFCFHFNISNWKEPPHLSYLSVLFGGRWDLSGNEDIVWILRTRM